MARNGQRRMAKYRKAANMASINVWHGVVWQRQSARGSENMAAKYQWRNGAGVIGVSMAASKYQQ